MKITKFEGTPQGRYGRIFHSCLAQFAIVIPFLPSEWEK